MRIRRVARELHHVVVGVPCVGHVAVNIVIAVVILRQG